MTKTELVIITIFFLVSTLILVVIAEKKRETGKIHIYDAPVITNWCDEGTFVIAEEPIKKIGETGLGRVVVRRVDVDGGDLFSAIVVGSAQDIPAGSVVKIKKVEYVYYPHSIMSFTVVVKHPP